MSIFRTRYRVKVTLHLEYQAECRFWWCPIWIPLGNPEINLKNAIDKCKQHLSSPVWESERPNSNPLPPVDKRPPPPPGPPSNRSEGGYVPLGQKPKHPPTDPLRPGPTLTICTCMTGSLDYETHDKKCSYRIMNEMIAEAMAKEGK